MARLPRYATDALLVMLGLLLTVAVAVDLARSTALAQRMRRDRLALNAYMHPRVVDPQLVSIKMHGSRDLVCVPRRGRHRSRVCIHVVHGGAGAAQPLPAADLNVPPPTLSRR
jgi:hypothetical protein